MRERMWEKPKQHASLQAMSARKKKKMKGLLKERFNIGNL